MTQPRLVGGRYELGELIGYGGMAEVHRGRDARLGRDVAIKILRPDLARDPSFLNRFRREAQSAAGLNHPAIVSVYDTGEDAGPDGLSQPYIVMEYVEGRTLRDILKSEGRLPAQRAMEITAEICGALDFSHKNGIIHRDIKPANVMITHSGAVKVMDFGIARAVADNAATVTQTANVIGTAQYLSPEQARGESVDPRSDVYSTGCLLYELVTGVPPFQGDSPVAVAYQHVRENAAAPSSRNPEVPRALDSIVMKALAKNQLNRYQSAGEMRADLQRALANQAVSAEAVMTDAERTQFISRTPPPPVALAHRDSDEPVEDERHRRTGLVWLAVVIAMLLVIGGVVALLVLTNKQDGNTPKTIAVPENVIGMTPAAATATLKQDGFKTISAGDPTNGPCFDNQQVSKGQVCTLDPAPGHKAKEDETITYHVFTPAQVSVPSEVGKQCSDASNDLHTLGLTPKCVHADKGGTPDQVVSQDPEPFTQVAPGSTVTLTVTTGKVKLPDVKKLSQDKARQQLNSVGFVKIDTSQTKVTHDKKLDNTVYDENPTPGIAYSTDTTISLVIYRYEKPPPTCNSLLPTTNPTGVGTGPALPGGTAGTGGSSTSTSTSPGGLPPCGQ